MTTETMFLTVELHFRSDVENAPKQKFLAAWGNGGWRFMKRDAVGQWRSVMGLPKPAPKMWAELPEMAMQVAP